MPWITDIRADEPFDVALGTFNTNCIAYQDELGLSAPDLAEIAGAATAFHTNVTAVSDAKADLANSVTAKDTQKTASKNVVSKWAKTFRANANIPDAILAALLLPPHETPGSETTPTVPLELTATANGNGDILLKWNRNGNIQGTTFQIEYRNSPSAAWVLLDTTTKRTFNTSWNPGQYVAYRVRAVRRGVGSNWTAPEVLWDTEEGVQLSIAA